MCGKYFPRYSILLIDGKNIFTGAFECFLEKIYNLSLFKKTDNDLSIPSTEETSSIMMMCLDYSLAEAIKLSNKYIKDNKIFCNTVVYFNLDYLESNLEIFNYTDKATIFKLINKFIKLSKKKKINFYADKIQSFILFKEENITIEYVITAKIKETLNIINFNLS